MAGQAGCGGLVFSQCGGFLGEWFLDEVAGGGLFLEGLLTGFGGFQFFLN